MRFSYSVIDSHGHKRPCCTIAFNGSQGVPLLALIDSGAPYAIASLSALEGVELGERIEKRKLAFLGREMKADVHLVHVDVVSPASCWESIELGDVPIAVVQDKLPFIVLGTSALRCVIVLLREHDEVVHIKPYELFEAAPHHRDGQF